MVADLHENTHTFFVSANAKRDELKAEYMARSGINLTRLLISTEPLVRQATAPLIQMMTQRTPPQLPVWEYATEALSMFSDLEGATAAATQIGLDLGSAEGLGNAGGSFEILACAENRKINVNSPLALQGEHARQSVASQVFSLLGGYQSPSPYDPLFSGRDADGQFSSRLNIVGDIVDWWDFDQQATNFDPGARTVTSAGSEDNVYQSLKDPYQSKNAPFDSLEELRLVRGFSDEFWATFVSPKPENPCEDLMTVYGTGSLNPNMAKPEAMLATLCSYISDQPLCLDTMEGAKFVQLVNTVRGMFPIPWFSSATDFVNFVEGKGNQNDLFPTLKSFLGEDPSLLFRPVTINQDVRKNLEAAFTTESYLILIQSTGSAGRSRVSIRSVVNFHNRWAPPPPNTAVMPATGVIQYWRVN
ncbi:MAG: general secretion pathway protein GspK [Myxococcales bacterium]|nr:MAG: general secretion pathway protein GspK [Myxococcales bacterium]